MLITALFQVNIEIIHRKIKYFHRTKCGICCDAANWKTMLTTDDSFLRHFFSDD